MGELGVAAGPGDRGLSRRGNQGGGEGVAAPGGQRELRPVQGQGVLGGLLRVLGLDVGDVGLLRVLGLDTGDVRLLRVLGLDTGDVGLCLLYTSPSPRD